MSNIPTIEELLRDAKRAGASDVHITVGIPPKMRVNGQLITMNYDRLLPPDTLQMLDQFMDERQRAMFDRDGEHDMSFSIPNLGRYRVNAYRQRGSVAIALRLVGTQVPSPEVLGVPESVIDLYQRKKGLILVTGPTGSGKSTTLYTALSELNKEDVNIITVEDPVEANIDGINQVQVNNKADLTFASALRSILRQDPDIIMIGEIRDQETASIAVQASITGHLVVSTLHTNSAASTITRLVDMGIEPYLIADATVGVIAQRLVRRLCPDCKREKKADAEDLEMLMRKPEEDLTIYEPCGCAKCDGTGFRGRIGVYEIMEVTPQLKHIISKGGEVEAIKAQALKDGMHTLRMSATELVLDGTTSVQEMMRVSFDL